MLIVESLRNEEKDKQSKESLDLQVALEKAWMSRSSLREGLLRDKGQQENRVLQSHSRHG